MRMNKSMLTNITYNIRFLKTEDFKFFISKQNVSNNYPIFQKEFLLLWSMARILSFDFGAKRTGIAVTDELQLIASGLTTIVAKDLVTFVKDYLQQEKVALFVVGKPKNLDNTPSESDTIVTKYTHQLKQHFPEIPIVEVDERFTSKMAFQSMIAGGLSKKKRQNKALLDEISATILLQSYLSSRKL